MENKFSFNISDENDSTIISISGDLDAQTAPELEKEIENLVGKDKVKIITDFTELTYISSAGLGVFMSQIENIRNKGGDLKLTQMSEKVYLVFELLGFPMLFDITKTKEEAIRNFQNALKIND